MPTCKLEDCAHCSAQYKTPACNPLVVHSCFAYRLIHVLIQNILDLFNQFGLGLREEPLERSLFDRVTLTGDNILASSKKSAKKGLSSSTWRMSVIVNKTMIAELNIVAGKWRVEILKATMYVPLSLPVYRNEMYASVSTRSLACRKLSCYISRSEDVVLLQGRVGVEERWSCSSFEAVKYARVLPNILEIVRAPTYVLRP